MESKVPAWANTLSFPIQDTFDRGEGIKAKPKPEENISAECKEKEPRWWIIAKCSTWTLFTHLMYFSPKTSCCLHSYGGVLEKGEDNEVFTPEEESPTEESQSPLKVLDSLCLGVRKLN